MVRHANIANDIIFRCDKSVRWLMCENRAGAYDLMKHEALSVNFDRDPLDVTVQLRITNVDRDHETLNRPVVERFADGVVVEIAESIDSAWLLHTIRWEGVLTECRQIP